MTSAPSEQPQSNSPFAQPQPPAQRAADEAARTDPGKQPLRVAPQDQSDTNRVLVRDNDGNPRWKDELEAERAAAPRREGEALPAERNDGPKYKIGEGDDAIELTEKEAKGLLERQALEQSRRATLPATPADYKLPARTELKLPQGIEFAWKENDPLIADARNYAHSIGLPQEHFGKIMQMYAAAEIQKTAELNAAAKVEADKLGVMGTSRVTAIEIFLKGFLGDATATPFLKTLVTEAQVRGWEKIMTNLMNQGSSATYTPQHHDQPSDGKVSDEQWAKMSPSERMTYASKFPQSH